MRTRLQTSIRACVWLGAGAPVVLAARELAYSLERPTLVGSTLAGETGGPPVLAIGLGACLLAFAAAATTVALAVLAVSERRRLEPRALSTSERIRPLAVAARALGLWLATSVAFALLESYLHRRAGLGWHGLHCLVGPVHRDAIPFLAALSAIAAAALAAAEHVLAWVRRTIGRLAPPIVASAPPASSAGAPPLEPQARSVGTRGARGPPRAFRVRPAGGPAGAAC